MAAPHKPEWRVRRNLVRLSLLWCASVSTYIVGWAPDDRVRETGLVAIMGLAASVLLGYLGFATYDDRNVMRHMRDRPPRDPPKHHEEEMEGE